jgi:hypothetical protein
MSENADRPGGSALARFVARLDDRANPIMLKQLRQAVRARYISVLLIAFLAIQLVVMARVVMGRHDFGGETDLGRRAFMTLYAILVGTCSVFVPLYVVGQLFLQRTAADVDLFALTTLRPRSVVWGRLLSGVLLSLLIYSAFAPFLTMSYLLRGIDLDVIMVLIVLGFSASVVVIAFGILLASIPVPRPVGLLLGVLVLGAGVMAVWGAMIVATLLTGIGLFTTPLEHFWGLFAMLMVSGGMLIGLFSVLTLALTSPRAANRALPVRAYLTGLWFVSLVLCTVWGVSIENELPLDPWMYANVGLFAVCILLAAGERDKLGPRVKRTIPRMFGKRARAFLFYSGSAGGITWATTMVALTLVMRVLWNLTSPPNWIWHDDPNWFLGTILPVAGLGAFAFAYAATAIILRTSFMPGRRTTWAWAFMILIVAASLIPVFVGALVLSRTSRYFELGPLYMLTPIALTDRYRECRPEAIMIAFVWAIIAGSLCRSWFVTQVRAFRRLEPVEPVETAALSAAGSPEPAVEGE